MTEIRVTLDDGANISLLRKMIENMKGVIRTSLEKTKANTFEKKEEDWLETLESIRKDIDPSLIDLEDERTKYILSK